MPEKPDFKSFYESELHSVLQSMEAERKKIKRKQAVVVAAAVIGFIGFFSTGVVAIPMVSILVLIIGLWMASQDLKPFKADFQNNVVSKIVAYNAPEALYEPNQGVELDIYRAAEFTSKPDRFNSEDLVKVELGKTKLEFCEVHAERKKRDSKGRTSYVTLFKGLFAIANFPKEIKGTTILRPDFAENTMGNFGKMFQKIRFDSLKLVELEDPVFEKHFAVYSDDQIEARYIFSTSFMARLTAFRKKVKKKMYLTFKGNQMYFGINLGRGWFNARTWQSIADYNFIFSIHEDCQMALSIVEDLNLNTRIWSHE